MGEWWAGLDAVTKGFYIAATFFSVLFLWQLIATLIGLSGGEEVEVDTGADADADVDVGHDLEPGDHPEFEHGAAVDAAETMVAFKLLSLRSILAFCMLFSWAGALYLNRDVPLARSLAYAMAWGLGAMLLVALLFYGMRRMTETGSPRMASCLGGRGTVYLDIPAGGMGEAKVVVSGVVSHVRARAVGGQELKAGTPIRVTRILGPSAIEVEPVRGDQPEG
ncbi:MAG: hypothetical protein AMJ81_07630 [Phycisphaerae bacterium SM23_33]|nr:MAG: hypothetical protein AMJ81_07630 [Phycisphaerae bacterium SM23_33]